MTACFAETFYFLALLNRRDDAHREAIAIAQSLHRPIVTTGWVLTELADGLADTPGRMAFPRFLERFRSDPRAEIVAMTDLLFDRAVGLYASRPDKAWSLTDCVSFVVMSDRGITDALTADHHFEQAGFTLMMK